ATRLPHAAERDVRREAALFRGYAEWTERGVDGRGERREPRTLCRTGPDDAWSRRRGKGAEAAELDVEGAPVRRLRDRAGDIGKSCVLDGAEELEGDVQVVDGGPGDTPGVPAQGLDLEAQTLPQRSW